MSARGSGSSDQDVMRYMVRCGLYAGSTLIGSYWAERDDADTDRATTIADLASGQFDKPLQVIELNCIEHICSDVSQEFAIEIASAAFNSGDCRLSHEMFDFCERHGGFELMRGIAAQ